MANINTPTPQPSRFDQFFRYSINNLEPISLEVVIDEAQGLLIDGEECLLAFHRSSEQPALFHDNLRLLFSNKRVLILKAETRSISSTPIYFNKMMKSVVILPYSKVRFFSICTNDSIVALNPSFQNYINNQQEQLTLDPVLDMKFTDGSTARFEFKGDIDIQCIGRIISEYIL